MDQVLLYFLCGGSAGSVLPLRACRGGFQSCGKARRNDQGAWYEAEQEGSVCGWVWATRQLDSLRGWAWRMLVVLDSLVDWGRSAVRWQVLDVS